MSIPKLELIVIGHYVTLKSKFKLELEIQSPRNGEQPRDETPTTILGTCSGSKFFRPWPTKISQARVERELKLCVVNLEARRFQFQIERLGKPKGSNFTRKKFVETRPGSQPWGSRKASSTGFRIMHTTPRGRVWSQMS